MNRKNKLTYIEEHKAVAVLRMAGSEMFKPVAEALYRGGIRILEITMTTPDAITLIEDAVQNFPDDLMVGVGSVLNEEDAQKSIDAGAAFIVCPITKKSIIDKANIFDIPVMAGAFTPTEIQTAWEFGSDIVKVFPANILGMNFFKAVKAPMPHLKLMPTGGVNLLNAGEWIDAGACAVGVGSALVPQKALKEKDYKTVEKNAQTLTRHLQSYRFQ